MNAAGLLKHFDRIAEAPDAVERLRRFVLDLAVRGKLVEQHRGDESATELLKRIRAEKLRVLGYKATAKKELLETIRSDTPFSLPSGWAWSQLQSIGFISPRNSAADEAPASFVGMTLIPAEYGVAHRYETRPWGEIKKGFTHFAEGDVGLAKITPCFENGKSTVFRSLVGGIGAGTTELHIVRPVLVSADYLLIFLKCPFFIETGIPKMTGTAGQKRVSTEYFSQSPLPLPPLAEQHRIVAKVDELMALCDQLQAAHTARESQRDALVAASLHRLTATEATPDQPAPPFTDAARFHLTHLPRLTTRPEHIQQLRQTILNLAVNGKLVEQNAHDEPATELLVAIAAEKETFIRQGIIRRQPTPVTKTSKQVLPAGWAPTSLGAVIHLVSGQHLQPPEYSNDPAVGLPYITGPADFGTHGLNISRFALVRKAVARKGQLLLTVKGSGVGKTTTCDLDEVAISRQLMAVTAIGWSADFLVLLTGLLAQQLSGQIRSLIPGIAREDVEGFCFGLPPLAEQHRIVAKVDELMQLCDVLKAELVNGQTQRSRLLEALLHEALTPSHENVVDIEKARKKREADREAIACYAVRRLAKHKSFGRTMQAKVLYMAEAHCRQSLGGSWRRQARGPYDGWIGDFEAQAEQAKWFSATETTLTSGKSKVVYTPGTAIDTKANEALAALGVQASEFDRLLTLFSEMTTEEVEIIATLFAAWNDLLLDGKAPSEDDIVKEVREHWHPDKARFTPDVLKGRLEWMRKHQLTAIGRSPHTSYQAGLL